MFPFCDMATISLTNVLIGQGLLYLLNLWLCFYRNFNFPFFFLHLPVSLQECTSLILAIYSEVEPLGTDHFQVTVTVLHSVRSQTECNWLSSDFICIPASPVSLPPTLMHISSALIPTLLKSLLGFRLYTWFCWSECLFSYLYVT